MVHQIWIMVHDCVLIWMIFNEEAAFYMRNYEFRLIARWNQPDWLHLFQQIGEFFSFIYLFICTILFINSEV